MSDGDGRLREDVRCGPVNDLRAVFDDSQVRQRGMEIRMPHSCATDGLVALIGNPIRYSASPVGYRRPPPGLAQLPHFAPCRRWKAAEKLGFRRRFRECGAKIRSV